MSIVKIPAPLVAHTIDILRAASTVERVVLWLGARHGENVIVTEVYEPMQETEADYFRIPQPGMAALLDRIRDRRLMVAAQVHTHPFEAFHSSADDRWAIVSHVGAISLVVPEFCQRTTIASFVADAKVYKLVGVAEFTEVAARGVYEVTP